MGIVALSRLLALLAVTARRLGAALVLLIGASFLIYITIRSAPGDAVDAITPMGTPPEIKAQLAAEFGLDVDPVTGYGAWLTHSIVGDFGESLVIRPGDEVMAMAAPRFAKSLLLGGSALFLCLALTMLLSILMGEPTVRHQGLTGFLYFVTAAPSFVAAVFFTQGVNEFVRGVVEGSGYETPPWYPIPISTESVMPYFFAGIVLVIGDGLFMDMLNGIRAEILAVRNSQFIAAIRAKGASTLPHIAKNLIVPAVSAYVSRLPLVLGGVVIVEYVFTLDGGGYMLLEASKQRDFPVVVGLSVLFTASIIVLNLVADVIRTVVDPREVARGG